MYEYTPGLKSIKNAKCIYDSPSYNSSYAPCAYITDKVNFGTFIHFIPYLCNYGAGGIRLTASLKHPTRLVGYGVRVSACARQAGFCKVPSWTYVMA